jgi:hypothetical protein
MLLAQLLEAQGVTAQEVEEHLNRLPPIERVSQVLSLSRKDQERLWELAGSRRREFGLDFLVPEGAPALKPFPLEGKNSLPMFTRFRKVFYRTPGGEIAGYNDQAMEKVTGPGYFMVEPSPERPGPVVVNYTRVPTDKPAGWPEIRPNEAGLSRFVYAGMHDYLRWVSPDVVIGRAYRANTQNPMPNWFMLVRPTKG